MITITPTAQKRINIHRGKKAYLRLSIIGKSCQGYQYSLQFTTTAKKNDYQEHHGTITILMSKDDAEKLFGTTIDYVQQEHQRGFLITSSQQKSCQGCSCGA